MRKIIFALCVTFAFCQVASATDYEIWKTWDKGQKAAYVVGIIDGYKIGGDSGMMTFCIDKGDAVASCMLNNKFTQLNIADITIPEIAEAIDAIYSDKRNHKIDAPTLMLGTAVQHQHLALHSKDSSIRDFFKGLLERELGTARQYSR